MVFGTRAVSVSLALALVGVMVGCSSSQPAQPAAKPADTKAAPAAPATPAAPKAEAPKQAPKAAPKALKKIVVTQSSHALSFAPLYLAIEKGYTKEEGLDVEFSITQGGTVTMAALQGGSAQFVSSASADPVKSFSQGANFKIMFSMINAMTMDVVVSNKFAQAKGITATTPIADVVKAMKGGNFGTASLGGAPDRYTRWLMSKYGFDAQKDINIIRIGGGAELLAAMKAGQLDGFMWPPEIGVIAEQEKAGIVPIRYTAVPEFKNFSFEVITAKQDYLDKNPDVAESLSRALAKGNKLAYENPKEAAKVLEKPFKGMDIGVIEQTMVLMKDSFADMGRMSEKTWDNAHKVMLESGAIEKALDIKEGQFWTNKYIPK